MHRVALLFALAATTATSGSRVGDVFQITTDREMEEHGNRDDSGQSSSTDRDSYVERVKAERTDGLVLEIDLPPNATRTERASNWQFPFRALKLPDGSYRLLNAADLETRIDPWLKAGGMTRAACGKLIFTWNAFHIDCDPQSTVRWLATVTLPKKLQAGSSFTDPEALAASVLRQGSANKLTTTQVVDPSAIRRQRAQTDVGVAGLMGKNLTFEAALKNHETEKVTGTITVTFDLDSAGRPYQRTRVKVVQIAWPNGRIDTQTITETLTRSALHGGGKGS